MISEKSSDISGAQEIRTMGSARLMDTSRLALSVPTHTPTLMRPDMTNPPWRKPSPFIGQALLTKTFDTASLEMCTELRRMASFSQGPRSTCSELSVTLIVAMMPSFHAPSIIMSATNLNFENKGVQ